MTGILRLLGKKTIYAACCMVARSGGGAPVICVCWPAAAAISGCWRYRTISDCLKYLLASII